MQSMNAIAAGMPSTVFPSARYAFQNQQAGASQTYIALADEVVVGYYTLVVGQVEYTAAPERLTKGLARHPVPIMLLARLAIATSWQGKGLGSGLLKGAMQRTLQAADIAGIRTFTFHAKGRRSQGVLRTFWVHAAAPERPLSSFPSS